MSWRTVDVEKQYDRPANIRHLIRTNRLFLVMESKDEAWIA